ncbi:MAG: amidohydrolase family protein [Candidatus Azotimanducaceae bacterium]|uniref:Amidohydrolase n=1 Tax=OM182 bacterium TaxID=2510334 RepID=A0A520S464_9GAMM|nr:MAG: amidohydrolase [OM182 bacterium]
MVHDIVIRNGSIVDGTGAEPVRGDLAIDGSSITAMGEVETKGKKEIDADGHLVTPGFIDLHTHLDAQIGWDPLMTPVSWHGVSTALLGNCGVTFAPCKPKDRELLAGMMETVEDIPKQAILSGLPWSWEDYGGYLDAITELKPSLNMAGMVGHCAVRFYVMGERAVEELATENEMKQMSQVVADSIDQGAFGFSTNRYEAHRLPDGRPIPGTFADPEELEIIGKEVGARNALMQAVGANEEVILKMSRASNNRILFSGGGTNEPGSGKRIAGWLDSFCEGRDITSITQVRGSGLMFGLQGMLPFQGEAWDTLREKDLAGRIASLNQEDIVKRLIEDGKQETWVTLDRIYYQGNGDTPKYTANIQDNLAALAEKNGESPAEMFIRISRESEGRALFTWRMFNQDLDELGELFKSKNMYPSLGDAGAHVSQFIDAGWSTFTLSHWMREKKLYTIGEGIRRMTSGPARIVGLSDRGVLRPGMRADVNVIDFDNITELHPEMAHDFPGGAPRYIQKARGYKATLINGQINLVDDELTGVQAGEVLRHRS